MLQISEKLNWDLTFQSHQKKKSNKSTWSVLLIPLSWTKVHRDTSFRLKYAHNFVKYVQVQVRDIPSFWIMFRFMSHWLHHRQQKPFYLKCSTLQRGSHKIIMSRPVRSLDPPSLPFTLRRCPLATNTNGKALPLQRLIYTGNCREQNKAIQSSVKACLYSP
jgi:hypothetical protein